MTNALLENIEQVIAIDPGDQESAAVWLDVATFKPNEFFEGHNVKLRERLQGGSSAYPRSILVLEYTPPYTMQMASRGGKPGRPFVPRQVVDTAIELGRFVECWAGQGERFELFSRTDVKKQLLGRATGNDTEVRAAVVDRYGGDMKAAKGTKAAPGPLYGFSGTHLYAAAALGIAYLERLGYWPPAKFDKAARVY